MAYLLYDGDPTLESSEDYPEWQLRTGLTMNDYGNARNAASRLFDRIRVPVYIVHRSSAGLRVAAVIARSGEKRNG